MLKGKARIELKDVRTGAVQMVEHENMFTNALSRQMNSMFRLLSEYGGGAAKVSLANETFLPLYGKGLGGILLFQNPLEEDPDNIAIPSFEENPLTGYASTNAYSGTDARRGGMNLIELEVGSNTVKYVWDFSTSQANGQISALALTSALAGQGLPYFDSYRYIVSSFQYEYTQSNAKEWAERELIVNGIENILDFDVDAKTIKIAKITSASSVNIIELSIFDFYTIKLNQSISSKVSINSIQTVQLGNDVNTNSMVCNGGDGYYYIVYATAKNAYISRIDAETLDYDASFGNRTFSITENYALECTRTNRYGTICNGYAYLYTYYGYFRFNLTDHSYDIIERNGMDQIYGRNGNIPLAGNGVIYGMDAVHNSATAQYSSNEYLYINPDGIGITSTASYYGSSWKLTFSFRLYKHYLATINNITPVTKTNTQTMKITYTVTEAE